jgi:steroid 5-alpha reductase family enzyme
MKLKHPINLHKGLTFFVVCGLMRAYDNNTLPALTYLALHGTYGFLWLLKDRWYPDRQWDQPVSVPYGILVFGSLCLYWASPVILIVQRVTPPDEVLFGSVLLNVWGVFLHFGSDAQKHFTLKHAPGQLITEGFFARNRNTNYLGEALIYTSFAMLAMHWLPFVVLGAFIAFVFVPNMLRKDKSLSRYPGFAAYSKRSGFFLPWPGSHDFK